MYVLYIFYLRVCCANTLLRGTTDILVRSDPPSIYFCAARSRCALFQRFCKETVQIQGASKNKAETYLLYVEHLFLRSNPVDAPYICKRLVDPKKLRSLIRREKAFLAAGFELYGDNQLAAALPRLYDIAVAVVIMIEPLSALPQCGFLIGRGT